MGKNKNKKNRLFYFLTLLFPLRELGLPLNILPTPLHTLSPVPEASSLFYAGITAESLWVTVEAECSAGL